MEIVIGESVANEPIAATRPIPSCPSCSRATRQVQELRRLQVGGRRRGSDHGTHSPGKHHQDLSPGRGRRAGAQGHLADHRARRNGRADGRVGFRQDDADEHPRLPRPPQLRRVLARRPGDEPVHAQPAGPGAHGQTGLRLPKLQSAAADQRAAAGDHAFGLLPAAAGRRRGHPPCPRAAGSRRPGRPHRPRAFADVRRPAAAGGHRPVAGQSSGLAAGRRADGQPRFAHQRGNPADVPATQRRGDHRDSRHARSQGGHLRPPHDPPGRRPGRRRRTPRARRFRYGTPDARQYRIGERPGGNGSGNGNGHAAAGDRADPSAAVAQWPTHRRRSAVARVAVRNRALRMQEAAAAKSLYGDAKRVRSCAACRR